MFNSKNFFLLNLFLLIINNTSDCLDQNFDLTQQLRNEYHAYKEKFLKIRKNAGQEQRRYWWINGYFTIDNEECPILYNIVDELAKKLELPTPDIFVFRGNFFYELQSYLLGADMKVNAWVSLWVKNYSVSAYVAIGEDLIENLNYDEIQAVLAHELGHIKKRHLLKELVVGSAIKYIASFAFGCMPPFIPAYIVLSPVKPVKISIEPVASYIFTMPSLALSYKFEKEADLVAFNSIKNHLSLVNGLEKIETIFGKKHPFWFGVSKIFECIIPISTHPRNKVRAQYLQDASEKNKKEKDKLNLV